MGSSNASRPSKLKGKGKGSVFVGPRWEEKGKGGIGQKKKREGSRLSAPENFFFRIHARSLSARED